jgi:membrane protein involved in colicin uptake
MAASLAELLAHASFQELQQQQPALQIELYDMLGTYGPAGSEAAQQLREAAVAEMAKIEEALEAQEADWAQAEQKAAAEAARAAAEEAAAKEAAEAAADAAAAEQAVVTETGAARVDTIEAGSFTRVVSAFAAYADCGFEDQIEFECKLERASRDAASAARGYAAAGSADDVSGDIYYGLVNDGEEAEQGGMVGLMVGLPQQLMGSGSPCKCSRVQLGDAVGSNGGKNRRSVRRCLD